MFLRMYTSGLFEFQFIRNTIYERRNGKGENAAALRGEGKTENANKIKSSQSGSDRDGATCESGRAEWVGRERALN